MPSGIASRTGRPSPRKAMGTAPPARRGSGHQHRKADIFEMLDAAPVGPARFGAAACSASIGLGLVCQPPPVTRPAECRPRTAGRRRSAGRHSSSVRARRRTAGSRASSRPRSRADGRRPHRPGARQLARKFDRLIGVGHPILVDPEKFDDVALRILRDGDDVVGLGHDLAQQAVGLPLVSSVVNGRRSGTRSWIV